MLLSLRPSPRLPLRRFFCRSSATPDMARYREAFARRMAMAGIKPHHRIALGVSGGPDSTALCILAAGWKSDGMAGRHEASGFIGGLLGIVVDHKLRQESSEEAIRVRERLNEMGIECEIACCDWADGRPKQGHLQEAAREMRYQIFQSICIKQQIGILLFAHHADDQAELLILRLSRNSGVLGLAGMAFVSQLFPTHLIRSGISSSTCGILLVRPMLEFSKDDMYKICQDGDREWVEDPTNRSPLFARNRIRACLESLPSCAFKSELQSVISACRLTRSYINDICCQMIKHSVTVTEHGYAILDVEKLRPSEVEDLCLSRFLTLILQFISQRHRPIRGSTMQLLLDFVRTLPCKTSFTAAGCYLCAAPQSKGTKIIVCCSVDSPRSSRMEFSYKLSFVEEQSTLLREIDQIIIDAKSYSDQSVLVAPRAVFMHAKSSMAILNEAKNLNLISESTLNKICMLQEEEHEKFSAMTEVKPDYESRCEMKITSLSGIMLHPGKACHFMGRFLVTWELPEDFADNCLSSEDNQDHVCQFCMLNQETTIAVRPMVDTDWLFLAKLSKNQMLEECHHADASICKLGLNELQEVKWSSYMQLSAQRALHALKSIPVSARRALPVVVDAQGFLLGIPSIAFRCCPRLTVAVVFRPRVPLGGGYSSYV